jgi:hypothetical protein
MSAETLPDLIKVFHQLLLNRRGDAQKSARAILELQRASKAFQDPVARKAALRTRFASIDGMIRAELEIFRSYTSMGYRVANNTGSSGSSSTPASEGDIVELYLQAESALQRLEQILKPFTKSQRDMIREHFHLGPITYQVSEFDVERYRVKDDWDELVPHMRPLLKELTDLAKRSLAAKDDLAEKLFP